MPTEIERHALYEKIKEEWGEGHADALMSHLPPVGWADVATKGDLDALRVATKQDLALLDAKLNGVETKVGAKIDGAVGSLRVELHRESINQLRWILTSFVGLTGVFAVIVSWLG